MGKTKRKPIKISMVWVLDFAVRLTRAGIAIGLPRGLAKDLACYTTSGSLGILLEGNNSKKVRDFKTNMNKLLGVRWKNKEHK